MLRQPLSRRDTAASVTGRTFEFGDGATKLRCSFIHFLGVAQHLPRGQTNKRAGALAMLRPPFPKKGCFTAMSIPAMTATAQRAPKPANFTTGTRRDSSWSARLVAAKAAGIDQLIAFGRALHEDQQTKAWAQWQGYKLWKHSQTGEPLGVIKIATHQPRRVQESYNQGVWHVSGPDCWFMSTISATNNALAIAAREHTDRAQELLAARANPKHAYILRLLVDAEKGLN